jgi:hypothetical protein
MDSGSWTWARAADFAATHGNLDLAIELRRRFWPVGRCSMDSSPQEAGMAFADLCYEAGRTGCYLQLQVRVMGDNIGTRVAWSSYGEASFPTYVERIAEIGVDLEQFLMGLVFRFDVAEEREVALGAWRLARAMIESGLGERFEAILTSYAHDVELDGYNRFQAAVVLANLKIRRMRDALDGGEDTTTDLLRELAADEALAPMATDWLNAQLARE